MAWGAGKHHPLLKSSDINLNNITFGIDKVPSKLKEEKCSFTFNAPSFRANATVVIPPLVDGQHIEIGWIQVCTLLERVSIYEEGITSMEIPELVTGKYEMMNDSDGSHFPWFGSKSEFVSVQGPTKSNTIKNIHMKDSLKSKVCWHVPSEDFPKEPSLSFSYRKQKFYTFLALKDANTKTVQVLKVIRWSMKIGIGVDGESPVGKRCKILEPFEPECQMVEPDEAPTPQCYALRYPTCYLTQTLVWRPYCGEIEVIAAPKYESMNVYNYAVNSEEYSNKMFRLTKEGFLKGRF